MTPLVLALADDATGALEVGAHFSSAGLECIVSLDPFAEATASALVLDTESRHLAPQHAAALHRRLACGARSIRFLFKKTDSTLRGNVAAELAALAAALPDRPLLYAPAYPRLGRTVQGGRLYVDGIPLEQTAFARDLHNPVRDSAVLNLFAAGAPVRAVSAIPEPLPNGVILICDAVTDDDLDRAAAAVAGCGRPHIAAGTGGFAAQWAQRLPDVSRHTSRHPAPAARALLVCGSLHPASREQVRLAAPQLASSGWAVLITPDELLPAPPELAAPALSALDHADALIVFGGDTAFSILRAAGVRTVTPITELLPGVPCSRFQYRGREISLITKAGGFGAGDTLLNIHRALQ